MVTAERTCLVYIISTLLCCHAATVTREGPAQTCPLLLNSATAARQGSELVGEAASIEALTQLVVRLTLYTHSISALV